MCKNVGFFLLYAHSSFAIILVGKRGQVALVVFFWLPGDS